MKSIVLFLLATCWSAALFAQLTVNGTALDEAGNPIPYANVTLHRAADSVLVKGALTDEQGVFLLEPAAGAKGPFFVRISMMGFQGFQTAVFNADQTTYTLGALRLQAGSTALNEVTVAAKVPFIERKLDRMVVNVENSIVSAGSSAMEVLERSPGVLVSASDAISLRGKTGVVVMIDGKPTPMAGADLANMLRGLPANAIERIEIITNPSAKYDAAGNAGIIDIRMKKDKRMGTNGTLTANYGQGVYPKAGAGINLNHRDHKWNLFAAYNFSYRKGLNDLKLVRRFYENGQLTGAYDQVNNLLFPFKYHTGRFGADFSPSKKTVIGVLAQVSVNLFNPHGENVSSVLDKNSEKESGFTTGNRSFDKWPTYALNGNFKHSFGNQGKELSADVDYARYWNETTQTFTTNYFNLSGEPSAPTYILFGDLAGNLQIRSFKADYTNPLKNKAKWETGIKTSLVTADNNVQFFDKSNGTPVYDSTKSNHFLYRENINAAYVNVAKEWTKLNVQVGLRAEQTGIEGEQLVNGQSFDSTYLNLFPSAFLNYQFSENYASGLNVSRRLDRPSYRQLNPFKFFLDPSTYREGNPYLSPQYTWSFEWTHTWRQKYTATLAYSHTTNNITEVIAPVPNVDRVTVQTDKNLAEFDYYGLSVNAPVEIFKWWTSINDFNAFYGHYRGNLANTNLSDGSVAYSINSNNSFTINPQWSAEASLYYQAPQVYGFMTLEPLWTLNAGIQKHVWDRRGTFKLNVTDIFWTGGPRATIVFRDYVEDFVVHRETRVVTLAFTYRFGSNQVAPSRRRAGGAEEEKRRAAQGQG